MMKVPLSVINGKSPMKTVWDLISPVLLFMNSAVTNNGAENVMSRSLHSSTEYFGSENSGSENDRDMVPWKSSMGEISSKISWSPDFSGTRTPCWRRPSTRVFHLALPSSQSKLSVCKARRLGTSRGSRILAKEILRGAVLVLLWCCLSIVGVCGARGGQEGSFRGSS